VVDNKPIEKVRQPVDLYYKCWHESLQLEDGDVKNL
jgi:hypothetical protein